MDLSCRCQAESPMLSRRRQCPSVAGQRPPQVTPLESGVGGLTNVHRRKKESEMRPF